MFLQINHGRIESFIDSTPPENSWFKVNINHDIFLDDNSIIVTSCG